MVRAGKAQVAVWRCSKWAMGDCECITSGTAEKQAKQFTVTSQDGGDVCKSIIWETVVGLQTSVKDIYGVFAKKRK